MFQLGGELRVISGLCLPYTFKLVKIVLAVKHLVLQARVWVFFKQLHLILPHCLVVKIQLFAAIAYCSEVAACAMYLTVNLLQNDGQLFQPYFLV